MNKIWKLAFVILLAVGGFLAFSPKTEAAAKPYEYTFEKDISTFNGISAINKMKITFDKNISELKKYEDNITVVRSDQTAPVNIISQIQDKYDDPSLESNQLVITFKNLNFIDYTADLNYKIVIKKETLRFDQIIPYEFPFKIYDILPGFKSTFIDTPASTINTSVFQINAPRDVMIHVPKIFIKGIETIHHYSGILPGPLPKEDSNITKEPVNGNNSSYPELTNIDVLAENEATRLKVTFKNSKEYERDLTRHPDVEGFTMGQAGINGITNNQTESLNEFQLRAYDDNGRFLEQRDFKLRVTDPKADYIINDYLPEPTEEFGKTYSLYDLMADQKLLENIITRIPVSQLDSLGVTYKVGNPSVRVTNEEELRTALENPNVTSIALDNDISLASTLTINRPVTIEGENKWLIGNVILGIGQDIDEVRLNQLKITGDLTVDVGSNGTAILDGVTVLGNTFGTKIISGGTNSIHLIGFSSTRGIILKNETPIRIVNSVGSNNDITIDSSDAVTLEGVYRDVKVNAATTVTLKDFNSRSINLNNILPVKIITADQMPTITFGGIGIVTLEGSYTTVNVQSNMTLNMTKNTIINHIEVTDGYTLTLDGSGGTITSVHGKTIFPKSLSMTVTAKAFAAVNSDEVVITFDRPIYTSNGGSLTSGNFNSYFTIKKNGTSTELTRYPVVDANNQITVKLDSNSDIKKGDVLTVGLQPGVSLYDAKGNPITGLTMDITVTSDDYSFLAPTATLAKNQITLHFTPAGDVDMNTVDSSDFSVNGQSISGISKNGDDVILTLNSDPLPGQSVTVYIANNRITDKVGNILPATSVQVPLAGGLGVLMDLVPGSTTGNTKATFINSLGAHKLYASINSSGATRPTIGTYFTGISGIQEITNGTTEMSATAGYYMNIYEVDASSNLIVGFESIQVQSADIK